MWAVNRLVVFSCALGALTALAMVGVFISSAGASLGGLLVSFLQYEALAVAGSIVTAMAYYNIMGVRKGDQVLVINQEPINQGLSIRIAVALENAKLHKPIRIRFGNEEVVGEVDSYPGFIYPARVSVKTENNIKVI